MAQRHVPLTFPNRPKNLKIGNELDSGAWGAVYNGELEGRPVAVKKIHELLHKGRSEEERRKVLGDFQEECKKLQAFSHPHVVGFSGAFNDPRLGPILVMEKMQENLRQFLNRWKNKLPLPKQLRISLEIIRGVAFLHQQTPPLVHRDLNDKNVMFSFEGVIKIGDFGQSKLKKDLYLTTGQPGMVIFMPPEALKDHGVKYNESLDIFSVGVLMLEIGTQQEPLVNLYGIGTIREVDRREKDLKALGEEHPLRPQILLCLKDNPKERPKASDLQREVLALVDGSAKTHIIYVERLQSMQKDLEKSRELEQKAKQELTECMQQMQREWESQEQMVRRLKQQHQEEVDELNARVRSAEDTERRWKANSQALLAQKEAEVKHSEEKLDDALQEIGNLQATADGLRSQITTLQTALAEAREENAARTELEEKLTTQFQATNDGLTSQIKTLQIALAEAKEENCARIEHEAILVHQFQADVASRDANIRQLEERCEQLEAQQLQELRSMQEALEERQEEIMRRLKQQHQEEVDELKAKVGSAEDIERRWEANNQAVLVQMEEEVKQVNEKLHNASQVIGKLQTTAEGLTGQITTLQTALAEAREENDARKKHEVKLQLQFQELKSLREALEESWELEQKANQDLTEHIQQLQKERDSQEEMVRRLKQQYQEEVDELKAKVRSAEGTERRWEANNQAVLVQMEEEVKQVNEKLHNASQVIGKLQMSLAANSEPSGHFQSFSSVGAGGMLPKDARGNVYGARFAGDIVEKDSCSSPTIEMTGPPLCEHNSIATSPLSCASGISTNAGRYPVKAVVGSSQTMAQSPMQRPLAKGHKVPPVQAHMYAPSEPSGKFATDPYIQRQESSVSPSTEGSLPMPLTRPGAVSSSQLFISEDIDSEIRHEAHCYKGDEKAVATPVPDHEEWPLDPNLTCLYCNAVFRRGQMQEFRHHVDDCGNIPPVAK